MLKSKVIECQSGYTKRSKCMLKVKVLVTQLCPALCDPMDCRTPGSSVHGILQVGILGVGCHFLLQEIFLNEGYICYLHIYGDTYIYISGHICIPTYTRFISVLKTCRDWKVWEKVFHVNRNEKRAGGEIFISDKVDFKNRERL